MYQRILVPLDGSSSSSCGLAEALKIARSMNSTVRLVHVVNEYVFDPAYMPSVYYEPWLEARRALSDAELDPSARDQVEHGDRLGRS